MTGKHTNQTDVNGFRCLKGFTGVEQVIPLNPDYTGEFSAIADNRNHDGKHMRRLLTENKEKRWNSNALTIKILPLNTGIRKVRVCFNAATNVTPNVESSVKHGGNKTHFNHRCNIQNLGNLALAQLLHHISLDLQYIVRAVPQVIA